ncbi:hypothetical protein BCV71DRAFT_214082 [Rhizopus microsporus]|uniref:Uncharacterized protein n=1 Tax=Rhizopus microsporus TaxID=58291 RepID=A0A1X0S497_RHIZD|nr:hypothetical protein BCV71DRAFT_214082 [Rhizopus microsporus]
MFLKKKKKKKEVGLIPTTAHALLEEIGNYAPLDLYTLKILDKWQAEGNADAYEQQYLR